MPTCIYCLLNREPSAFSAEHVIPRAFGIFEQNLTLDCVCSECNGYFGKTIELAYTRDSLEALLRLHYGVKPAREAGDLPKRRLTITLGGDDDWNGCHIELTEESGQFAVDLVPQVRFARRSGGWIFVTGEALADTTQPLPDDIDTSHEIRLVSRSDQPEMEERLVAGLTARSIPFTRCGYGSQPPSIDGRAPLNLEVRFDAMIFRCVAKIAFNYMAWVAGDSFVRASAFDSARSFIRHDVRPSYPLVVPHSRPILENDSARWRQTNGHLLTLAWTPDARGVEAQVSLFNEVTYRVTLTRNYEGLWREVVSGHHFDVETRRIAQLAASPRAPLRGVG